MDTQRTDTIDPAARHPGPRRPGRARDIWAPLVTWRNARRAALVVLAIVIAVPTYGWIDHTIRARRAYAEGREAARTAIADGYPTVARAVDPRGEVFVDPVTGLLGESPMVMRCVVYEFEAERSRGYEDEIATAFSSGTLAPFDRRPKLRTEDEALVLFERHAADVVTLVDDVAAANDENAPPRLRCTPESAGSEWSQVMIAEADNPEQGILSTRVKTPARALFVDDGATLLLIDATTSVQVLDLERPACLAWYGGWMSARPRN